MAFRGGELSWPQLASEFEEGSRVSTEIVDVEHGLRIRKVGEVGGQSGIDAVATPKVGDAARNRHLSIQ